MKRLILLLAAAFTLFGCGATADGGAGEPTDRTQYPEVAYGLREGHVIAPLEFVGADGQAFGLRDIFADEKNRVLLVTTAAGWCGACIEEQPKLSALHAEFAKHGLFVMAAMFEDGNANPATLELVQGWIGEYKLPYRMVLDDTFKFGAYYDPRSTPMNMVVDVDDMKILKITTGFDEQVLRAVIKGNLDL